MASEVRAREFTARGIERARQFLAEVRANPTGRKSPPPELIDSPEFTRPFRGELTVRARWHSFGSRREIGEYLAPKLSPFQSWVADRTSFWSWLGVFHFEDTARIEDGAVKLSPLDETFVIDRRDQQNLRGIHRHCLRSAWQLYEVHGEDAAFLLDQPPWARGSIANEILQSQRVFSSAGVVPLILRFYTDGNRSKRGFQGRPGGLPHLLRVLDQLERTHDVYGMTPDALIRILPPEFEPWANGQAKATDADVDTGAGSESAETIGQHDGVGAEAGDQSGDIAAVDTKLLEWEKVVRKNGYGIMRYRGFRVRVEVQKASDELRGKIMNPEARPIGVVSALDGAEFKRAMRRRINEYLGRK